jgi:hypothetical protein
MKRGLQLVASLVLLSASVFGLIGTTGAHPVAVDASPNEWIGFGLGPNEDNTAHVIRNTLGQGEFAWFDQSLDNRNITSTRPITREVDLRQVRVTADATNLSFYIQLANLSEIDPNPPPQSGLPKPDMPQIQIAIDRGGSGTNTLVPPVIVSPTLTINNPWEFLIQTRFPEGVMSGDLNYNTAQPYVYTNPGTRSLQGSAVIQKVNNSIEIQVPWNRVGNFPANGAPVRFTVVSLRESGANADPADGVPYNILDTVTPRYNGGPSGITNTRSELADGKIDYSFEVRFDPTTGVTSAAQGEVFSPLLITEVGLYPTTGQGNPAPPNGSR